MDLTLPLASGVEIALAVVALTVAIFSSIALRPKPQGIVADKTPSTLASRGAYIPWFIGRRRVGAVVGWVGDRRTTTEGGGGGKGGDSGDSGTLIYHERAWHLLAVGPASVLHRIFQDGRNILDAAITPGTNPSGSTVNLGREGAFQIYWGEAVQPVNTFLGAASRVTIASRWPNVAYLVWDRKRLGPQTRWPIVEYDLECPVRGTPAIQGPGIEIGVPGGGGYNPMYMIESMLCEPFPFGIGLDKSLLDIDHMGEVAQLLADEGMGVTTLALNGETAESMVTSLLVDMGMLAPLLDGRLRFEPVRPPPLDQLILTEDMILQPLPEVDSRKFAQRDALTFVFNDRDKNYREMSIVVKDDGSAVVQDAKKGRVIQIVTAEEYSVASAIADRRAQEELAQNVRVKLYANRSARALWAGLTITAANLPHILRILSIKPAALTSQVELECLLDFYGAYTGFQGTPGADPIPPVDPTQSRTVGFVPIQEYGPGGITPGPAPVPGIPPVITGPYSIIVAWIRPDEEVLMGEIHASDDGSNYQLVGVDTHRSGGGELLDEFPIGDYVVEEGPRYQADGFDEDLLEDLTPMPTQWLLGIQVALIAGEIFFVRNIEALGSGEYRLRGLVRARFGTPQVAHAAGAEVIVTRSSGLVRWSSPLFQPGTEIRIKVRPVYSGQTLSLADVDAGVVPLPALLPRGPVGLRSDVVRGRQGVYVQDLGAPGVGGFTVRWEHFVVDPLFPRSYCGLQLAGEATGMAPPAGDFELEVWDEALIEARITRTGVQSPQSVDGDEIDAAPSLGFQPTIWVRVRERVAGLYSPWSDFYRLDVIAP